MPPRNPPSVALIKVYVLTDEAELRIKPTPPAEVVFVFLPVRPKERLHLEVFVHVKVFVKIADPKQVMI